MLNQESHPGWKSTRLTRLLGIELPIVLGPFGGASSTALVAQVSSAGGLGSFGAYGLTGERILAVASEIRAVTDRPFAFNLWVPHDGSDDFQVTPEEFARHLAPLESYFAELGVAVPESPTRFFPSFAEQFEAVLEACPAAVSFVYGAPPAGFIQQAKERGITLIGTASTAAEAVFLERAGMDVVVASGFEAAGHRVSFLADAEDSLVGSLALVPQVVDAVQLPVVAAGGISTGRLARGIPNGFSRQVAQGSQPIAPFPLQSWLLGRLKQAAIDQGRDDLVSLWAGQSAGMIRFHRASDVIDDLVAVADRLLAKTDL